MRLLYSLSLSTIVFGILFSLKDTSITSAFPQPGKHRSLHFREIPRYHPYNNDARTPIFIYNYTGKEKRDRNDLKNMKFSSSALPLSFSTAATSFFSQTTSAPRGLIRHGVTTFLNDWKTFVFIPFVAAFVGWFTNYLAVQMIFYPIRWRGIPLKQVEGHPFGLFGWQGIIPAKTTKMSEAMVNVTINQLIDMGEIIQKLDPEEVADNLVPQVPEMVQDVLEEEWDIMKKTHEASASSSPEKSSSSSSSLGKQTLVQAVAKALIDEDNQAGKWIVKQWLGRSFLRELTLAMQRDITSLFNVRNCVVSQMMSDRSLLGMLFQKTGNKELKFLIDSGLWFGFLLGCLQLLLSLYCSNPWTLSFGGLVVGLATNWLALKWIFEPVEPTRIGPVTLQGLFLRRQNEVAKDFSDFFTSRILHSREIWHSILNDPCTSPRFQEVFYEQLIDLSARATGGLASIRSNTSKNEEKRTNTIRVNVDAPSQVSNKTETKVSSSSLDRKNSLDEDDIFQKAVLKLTSRLPYHFEKTSFHSYVNRKLGIKNILRSGLENLSSKEFEQVLHPIFEEDELTLILAGGALGFSAGFIQQLLSTGVWVLPSWNSYAVVLGKLLCLQTLKKCALLGISFLGLHRWIIPHLPRMRRRRRGSQS